MEQKKHAPELVQKLRELVYDRYSGNISEEKYKSGLKEFQHLPALEILAILYFLSIEVASNAYNRAGEYILGRGI